MDQAAADKARQIVGMKAADTTNSHPEPNSEAKPKVFGGRLEQSEFKTLNWVIDAPQGVTPEDILRPEFWSGVAEDLKPFNRIEVRADDGTWMTELLVLIASRAWASVHVLHHHDLTTGDVDQTLAAEMAEPFFYKYMGRSRMHCVIRRSDNEVVFENGQSQVEARAWLKERLKAGA